MKFEGTLERAKERYNFRLNQAVAKGYKEPPEIKEIFNLIKDSKAFWSARIRSIAITRDIQPSITGEDLKTASDMQLAMASALVLNLMREGLIAIKKV